MARLPPQRFDTTAAFKRLRPPPQFHRAFMIMFRTASGDPWPESLPLFHEDGSTRCAKDRRPTPYRRFHAARGDWSGPRSGKPG